MGYLMLKSSLFNSQLEDEGVHTFPKGIIMKVNVIVLMKFRLAYYNVIAHYASPKVFYAVTKTYTL